jgi:hypothetical protein
LVPGCSTGELNTPLLLVTVCASASRFVQWTVVPALTVTTCGPKAKLWIVTESEATGLVAGPAVGAGEGIPLISDGIAVGNGDGDLVPVKPASLWPLAGLIAALAELLPPPPPQAASSTVPAAAATVTAAHQRRFQRR